MDLRKAFEVTMESLTKEREAIVHEKQILTDKASLLSAQEKDLASAAKELEKEAHAVSDIKDVKVQKLANEQWTRDLTTKDVQLKQKEIELKKYENKLFEIKSAQDETDTKLREREVAVALREKTYKEEVEKAFAANLAKNLLTK